MENQIYEPTDDEVNTAAKSVSELRYCEPFVVFTDKECHRRQNLAISHHEMDYWEDEYILYNSNTEYKIFKSTSFKRVIRWMLQQGWKLDMEYLHNKKMNKLLAKLD